MIEDFNAANTLFKCTDCDHVFRGHDAYESSRILYGYSSSVIHPSCNKCDRNHSIKSMKDTSYTKRKYPKISRAEYLYYRHMDKVWKELEINWDADTDVIDLPKKDYCKGCGNKTPVNKKFYENNNRCEECRENEFSSMYKERYIMREPVYGVPGLSRTRYRGQYVEVQTPVSRGTVEVTRP